MRNAKEVSNPNFPVIMQMQCESKRDTHYSLPLLLSFYSLLQAEHLGSSPADVALWDHFL